MMRVTEVFHGNKSVVQNDGTARKYELERKLGIRN